MISGHWFTGAGQVVVGSRFLESAGMRVGDSMSVCHPTQLALLAISGLIIAAVGALLPAGWAARTRTAAALRTE